MEIQISDLFKYYSEKTFLSKKKFIKNRITKLFLRERLLTGQSKNQEYNFFFFIVTYIQYNY